MRGSKFFRTWTGVVGVYSYYSKGNSESAYTPIQYYKSNVQPWKPANGTLMPSGSFLFEDYTILYTKDRPTFTEPQDIPVDATEVTLLRWYYFFDGKWYAVVGDENWTEAGRQPKHFKFYGDYTSGEEDIFPDVGEPTPMASLVDEFENVVNELQQVSNFY